MVDKNNFVSIESTNDGMFSVGEAGVSTILNSIDNKIVLVFFENEHCLLGVNTRMTYVTYYLLQNTVIEYPIKAVLMDLDGTTLYSEHFWIHVIEKTMRKSTGRECFQLSQDDLPFISGHSVSEHLQYCIDKYAPSHKLSELMQTYYFVSQKELKDLLNGKSAYTLIEPAVYLKEFLQKLSANNIKVGLVTSGLYEKAYPEILDICLKLNLGNPESVYDCIITAGMPLRPNHIGTMGELAAKPHPWLYLENALIGLGLSLDDRTHIIGIEDSGAGICALRAAGIPAIGVTGGNIIESGMKSLCIDVCEGLEEISNKFL